MMNRFTALIMSILQWTFYSHAFTFCFFSFHEILNDSNYCDMKNPLLIKLLALHLSTYTLYSWAGFYFIEDCNSIYTFFFRFTHFDAISVRYF